MLSRPHGEEIAGRGNSWEDLGMAPEVMDALLKLPESERVDLAMALWASLEEATREAALELTPEQAAEFDRRLAEHRADPSTAISWEEVRRKFVVVHAHRDPAVWRARR
jgi:putative addiction module component (TIGR02574 family)